jgi:hypothetical protein
VVGLAMQQDSTESLTRYETAVSRNATRNSVGPPSFSLVSSIHHKSIGPRTYQFSRTVGRCVRLPRLDGLAM